MTRDVGQPESYEQGWRRALAHALTGDLDQAERELLAVWAPVANAPAWESLAADLAGCLLEMIKVADDGVVSRIETITLAAEMDGWPWLARLGRSLQTTAQLHGAGTWRVEAAFDLLAGTGRGGDRWSQLVSAAGIAIAAHRAGAESLAADARRRAVGLCRELGAPVLLSAVDRLSAEWPDGRPGATAAGAGAEVADGSTTPTVERVRPAGSPVVDQHPTPGPVITLSCLGGFALRVGGREVDCRSLRPRARSLLMLLSLHYGRPKHRELIIETLWPEATLASGIRSLQVAVSSVRQCLAAGGVAVDPILRRADAYELALPRAVSDLVEFERLADEARRRPPADALAARTRALDLYRGELLPEVGPAEWVVEERDRLRLVAATVAAAAAADAVTVGDHGSAIELARRSIALDPFHDPAWSLLIDAYENLGDLSAAAVARSDHRRVWDDLGLVVPPRRRVSV